MSTNDVRHGLHSPTTPTHFSSLSRSATTSKLIQSSKAFGEKTYMNKEDHDRERSRWLSKLEEIEVRLADSETLNSDMHQIKAELNKKIVDLEKNQRPLIEQNRRVNERNKALQQEIKRIEQKLCHSQDDFLTLKDAHERLAKENAQLKEKRTYPEKLEELERYRNQVLEYSKCITALRSSGLEKDRRYELLVQKFKRLRRCIKKGDNEDDRQSTVGSDCSAESSISLDTITEDFEESFNKDIEINYQTLYRENIELQKALQALKLNPTGLSEESLLRDQLTFAHTTIEQQQILIDSNQEMISQCKQLKEVVACQQQRIKELEQMIEEMARELSASKEANELLEFQVLEQEENSKCEEIPEVHDKASETEEFFDVNHDIVIVDNRTLTHAELYSLKKSFSDLKSAVNLKLAQRQIVGQTEGYIENLEEQILLSTVAQNEKSKEFEAKVKELQIQIEDSYSKQKRKKELQIEVEELRKKLVEMDTAKETLDEEMRTLSKEMGKLRFQLQNKDSELEKEKKLADGLNKHLQDLVDAVKLEKETSKQTEKELLKTRKELENSHEVISKLEKEKNEISEKHAELSIEFDQFKMDQRPSIRTELERRYEETRYRLNTALEKIHQYEVVLELAKKTEANGTLSETLQEGLIQLKEYNDHLERQFQAQTDLIEALKNKVVQQKSFADFIYKLSDMDDVSVIQEELGRYAKSDDRTTTKLVDGIGYIIKIAKKDSLRSATIPLEISTAHHKIRPYNSVDSSGEWLSNSSEGIISPDDGESLDWNDKRKSLKAVQCDSGFSQRSPSAQSS